MNSHGIDVGIYDISKCFDKMWYTETSNDLFKAGVQDDTFILVTNSNKDCQVAVKTPWGSLTERVTLNELEMQGTVLSNIKCSVQVNSLGKDCIIADRHAALRRRAAAPVVVCLVVREPLERVPPRVLDAVGAARRAAQRRPPARRRRAPRARTSPSAPRPTPAPPPPR